ncbi:MAG TPA: RteC domain-containing protein [Gillisia sp.]|nr:RteC domain-containing protein [Gillisia sp.]
MNFILTYKQIEEEILEIKESTHNRLVVYDRIITFLRSTLEVYRKGIHEKRFKNIKEEILFFRHQKQEPQSLLIFYLQLRSLDSKFPYDHKCRKQHLQKKIEKIYKFYSLHSEFCKYIDLEQNHLDHIYFTRQYLKLNEVPTYHYYSLDSQFNTSHDILLSELKASKMLLSHFLDELNKQHSSIGLKKNIQLEWTSSKVALTELIYALQSNDSINKGKAEIITIASVFEELFDIKLDNIYKTYSEIKSRKGSRTKFLDELTWQFEQKMKGDDAY